MLKPLGFIKKHLNSTWRTVLLDIHLSHIYRNLNTNAGHLIAYTLEFSISAKGELRWRICCGHHNHKAALPHLGCPWKRAL